MEKIRGLLAAVFTPFHEDGTLNVDMIPILADKMVQDGLTGIFVCGSNGEGPNMTIEERMQVAAAFVKAIDKRIKVIVHVGHSCLKDCQRLAAHAAAIGADAFSSVAAFYFKPSSELNLARCMAEIAAAAPGLPFYYYHIPVLTGMHTNMIKFLQHAEELIPNLAGIKYTASLINEYQTCLNYKDGKFDILYGYDELLLPALAVGAKAAIGSTYTFAAPLYLKTMELFNSGQIEKARDNHKIAVDMINEFVKYPSIPAQKAILKMLGYDLGASRLPLETLSEKDYDALHKALDQSGFFKELAQSGAGSRKTVSV